MIDFLEMHARDKGKLPTQWRAYRYRRLPERSAECLYLGVTGAVVPDKVKGKYKGHPNWRAKERSHETEIYFTPQEHHDWLLQWERSNNMCHACEGSGMAVYGWSVADGEQRAKCVRCNGTGLPPASSAQAGEAAATAADLRQMSLELA